MSWYGKTDNWTVRQASPEDMILNICSDSGKRDKHRADGTAERSSKAVDKSIGSGTKAELKFPTLSS